jgi:hypothetical protein
VGLVFIGSAIAGSRHHVREYAGDLGRSESGAAR